VEEDRVRSKDCTTGIVVRFVLGHGGGFAARVVGNVDQYAWTEMTAHFVDVRQAVQQVFSGHFSANSHQQMA